MELLEQLCAVPGVPGREERIRGFIEGALDGSVDGLETDPLGNLIAVHESADPGAKRVLVAAHMDQIGFYVSHVDDEGFVRLLKLGHHDARVLAGQQVTLCSSRGGDLEGVVMARFDPPHMTTPEERRRAPGLDELFVDLGLPAETVRGAVRVGDPVTLRPNFLDLGGRITSAALDNRVGCWLLIELLRRLERPRHHVYAVFTVQEEVGLRGAGPASYGIDPDLGIALDVTAARDVPGVPPEQRVSRLGSGAALKIADVRSISARWLIDEFAELAEREGIDHQLEVFVSGGTDAAPLQLTRAGVPTLTLSVPLRHIHSGAEMVDKGDLNACLTLLTAYLEGEA